MEPLIGQILLFAGNFAPRGWMFCQGQILSIAQNTALFSILGTTYGGNGQTTFALPDLRGRVPVGPGQGPGLPSVILGEMSGAPTHTLIITEMPAHNHVVTSALNVNNQAGTVSTPVAGNSLAAVKDINTDPAKAYNTQAPNVALATGSISNTAGISGGSQPHNNMQPYLGLNFIIAVEGVYPSRN